MLKHVTEVGKKNVIIDVRNIEFISKQLSKSFVYPLSLLFCHSSSNSVSIPVYFVA